jgi:AcrR family transcriptional regulator
MPRGRLNRDRILRAAVEFADKDGVGALTVRELAGRLGFEAMALYRHVASKDEILAGMMDVVLADLEPIHASGDWASAIRKGALQLHGLLTAHPWAAGLFTRPTAGMQPARIRFMESLLACLAEAGFSKEATYHAYHVLEAHIVGYSLWLAGHDLTRVEQANVARRIQRGIFAGYPRLLEHHAQHRANGPHRRVNAFEVGLDLILKGLAHGRL